MPDKSRLRLRLDRPITVCQLVLLFIATVPPASAQDKIKFPVSASSKTLGYSPLWVAQKQGFFDRQGLDVQLVLVSGADRAVMALVGGSVLVGTGAIDATIGAVEQGADLVTIGGIINGLTHMLMGGKKFRNYEDLRGANIGSSGLTSGTAFVLRKMLQAKGLQYPKDYNLINIGPSAQAFLAVTAGKVDAALLAIPLSFEAADLGFNVIGRAVDVIANYQLTDISAKRSWAEKNRPTLVRFMRAMIQTMHWLHDNRTAAIDFLSKEMKLKPDLARRGYDYYIENKIWYPNAEANMEGVKTVIQIMGERGLFKGSLPAPSKYVDHSYAEEALKELGMK